MILLNENEYVEDVLEHRVRPTKIYDTIYRIAKYYFAKKMTEAEVRKRIEDYLVYYDPTISVVNWYDAVSLVMKSAKKNKMISIGCIPVYASDIECCSKATTKACACLLFTMICTARYFDTIRECNNHWINLEDRDLFALANIKDSSRERSRMEHLLYGQGLIEFNRSVTSLSVRVKCMDNAETGDPLMFIDNFRDLGNRYRMLIGEPYTVCEQCGAVVRKRSNRQRFCAVCAAENM